MAENLVNDDTGSATGQPDPNEIKKRDAAVSDPNVPGRRLENPLSRYASYTYNISLYMITPAAYETFTATGRKNIGQLAGGVYVVAQCGGVDDSGTLKRPPGFEFDYYIDNLKLKTTTGGKSTQQDSNITECTFDIIEPNGFSFVTKLARASREIKTLGMSGVDQSKPNAVRQFFILGIRFTGYDADGNVVKEDEVIERYYDIYVVSLKFRLNGKSTTYNIKAASLQPTRGFGNMHGRLNSSLELYGNTVGKILKGSGVDITVGGASPIDTTPNTLIGKLNYDQQKWANEGGFLPMEYDVEFIGEDAQQIANAKLQLPGDIDKLSWPSTIPGLVARTKNAMSENGSTIKDTPSGMRVVSFAAGTSILQAISNIIARSTYLTDALKTVYDSNTVNTSDVTDNQQTGYGTDVADKPATRPVRWYNISTRISNIRYDPKRRDWVYKITYQIRVYETPNVVSSFAGLTSKYYGPHKRYQYWFTGLNSEIVSYEQNFNSAWYMADYSPDADAASGGGRQQVPATPGQMQNIDRTQTLGIGMQSQASYLTSLYSPGDQVTARIRILGDPDFLMQDSPSGVNQVYNKFYGDDGFTVNPNGGQVFIEINFNEAVDYDYEDNDGLMTINDSILFWAYSPEVRARIKGNSYQVLTVESEFSRGAFFQNIFAVINPLTSLEKELAQKRSNARPVENESAAERARLGLPPVTQSTPQDETTTVPDNYGVAVARFDPDVADVYGVRGVSPDAGRGR